MSTNGKNTAVITDLVRRGPLRDTKGRVSGGNPGNKGGGRPPDEFKALMRELGSSPDAIKRLREILKSKNSEARDFLAAHKHVIEHGYGKAPQPIEGGDERKPLTIRLVRESGL